MKRTLALTIFVSLPLLGQTNEEAKMEVAKAQADFDAAQRKADQLKSRCDAGQQKAASVTGKVEYADAMERQKESNRQTIEEYNKAVDACKAKLEELQSVISRTGKEHTVTSTSGKFEVVETPQTELKPIVRTSTEGTRQPYARSGSTY